MKSILLPTTYFGNIEYYSLVKQADNILIEAHEHYVKQTFRNRCMIATANGPLSLSIPVKYSNKLKTKVKDVQIDYDTHWQKIHYKAIESAYRKSPFYEHYIDDFRFVFDQKEKYLLDLNNKIHQVICTLLGIQPSYTITIEYKANEDASTDYRNTLTPKSDSEFITPKYYQVFEEKHGFLPNLSILDLLFCEGKVAF